MLFFIYNVIIVITSNRLIIILKEEYFVRDTKTLDCLTTLQFKNFEANERWCKLVRDDYLYNHDTEIIMNFARRWAKIIQYLMKNENTQFKDIVVSSAVEANIDNAVTKSHAQKAIDLLIDIWQYGDILQEWTNNGGRDTIINLF